MIIYNQIKACLLNLKKGGIPMQQKCGMLINNVNILVFQDRKLKNYWK